MKTPPNIQVRRSARAKRLKLAVKPGLIELVIPLGMAESQALDFLNRHRAWAEQKLQEINLKAASRPTVPGFCSSSTLPWRGKEIPLQIREEVGLRLRVAVDEAVHISLPSGLGERRDEIAKRALYAWVRVWLRGQVALLAQRHGQRFGLHPRDIRIKDMKTRWGSCGPKGDININWLLAFVPPSVLEYVVAHEICHLKERNHSPAFWSLVAKHLPRYLEERTWLKTHGGELMRRFSL